MRAQKDLRREADLGDFFACSFFTGGLRLLPGWAFSYELRPFSFRPPVGFLPAERFQASALAITYLLKVGFQLSQKNCPRRRLR